ncbi:phosphatase PAP2 family protein [Sphingobium bisphenolivorans]|uniref:phosphatase PAP2 family protein n=1 Tax=Sphingobium bisphenolivorans TaxID=1335760 RepID=UPI0003A4BCE0|nr:phosphatase PAP2 family protein [Sphingobium bisphenolivorans]
MTQTQTLPERRIAQLPLPERLDVKSIELLRPWLEKPAVKQLGKVGNVADEPPLMLLSAAILIAGVVSHNPKLQRTGLRMGLAHLIAISLKELGKNNVDRTRPDQQLKEGSYHMEAGTSRSARLRSFPSGHTAGALALARAFSREYPRYTKPLLTVAAVVGALQVPRRAHYPGDVVAGGFAGALAEKAADLIIYGAIRLRSKRRRTV